MITKNAPRSVADMLFVDAGLPCKSLKDRSPKTVWVVYGPPLPSKATEEANRNIVPSYYSQPIFIGRSL